MHDYRTPPRHKLYRTDVRRMDKMLKILTQRPHTEKELIELGVDKPTQIANLCRKSGTNVRYRSEDLNKNPFNPNKNLIKTFYIKNDD